MLLTTMENMMEKATILCLLFCACASSTPLPSVIENSIPAPREPTLKDNISATVSVFYTYSNPDTGEMFHSQVIGVVLDAKHVLAVTINESDAAWLIDWKNASFVSASVMPYTPDVSGHLIQGPASSDGWFAKIVANIAHIGILEVSQLMPIYPVVFAVKKPRAGETVYTLSYNIFDASDSVDD